VFAAKTAGFREALSAILGIKLTFSDNEQERVTSKCDFGAAFVFQPARGIKKRTSYNGRGVAVLVRRRCSSSHRMRVARKNLRN
jgi:hypothetical protein